jgi:hypothetical protein
MSAWVKPATLQAAQGDRLTPKSLGGGIPLLNTLLDGDLESR